MTNPGYPMTACLNCGNANFQDGFVDDTYQGRVRWLAGALEAGPLGNTKRAFKDKLYIRAVRCSQCFRLELFAVE